MGHESSPVPVLKSILLLYLYRKGKLLRKICIKDFHSINILLVHCNQKIRGRSRKVFIFYFIYIALLELSTMLKVNKICFLYLMNNFFICNFKLESSDWNGILESISMELSGVIFKMRNIFWNMDFCFLCVWISFAIL